MGKADDTWKEYPSPPSPRPPPPTPPDRGRCRVIDSPRDPSHCVELNQDLLETWHLLQAWVWGVGSWVRLCVGAFLCPWRDTCSHGQKPPCLAWLCPELPPSWRKLACFCSVARGLAHLLKHTHTKMRCDSLSRATSSSQACFYAATQKEPHVLKMVLLVSTWQSGLSPKKSCIVPLF